MRLSLKVLKKRLYMKFIYSFLIFCCVIDMCNAQIHVKQEDKQTVYCDTFFYDGHKWIYFEVVEKYGGSTTIIHHLDCPCVNNVDIHVTF